MEKFITFCIPTYNRPLELERTLNSIYTKYSNEIEILISENNAPKRKETREVVENYRNTSIYELNYYENEENYGYDKNLRLAAYKAKGKWVMFISDDDELITDNIDSYIHFLKNHEDLGYVLRRYCHSTNGKIENFMYDNKDVFFEKGEDSFIELFRRSVFLSGFTFKKECFNDFLNDTLDGTLLFQLYIQGCICLNYPSAYCNILISKSYEGGIPYFGNSESEKQLYESEKNTVDNSINFLKQIFRVCELIDIKYKINSKDKVLKSYSKYSYGYLYEHRDKGIRYFNTYAKKIKNMGLGDSIYFYIYYFMLLIFGKNFSKSIIRVLKNMIGRTPKL